MKYQVKLVISVLLSYALYTDIKAQNPAAPTTVLRVDSAREVYMDNAAKYVNNNYDIKVTAEKDARDILVFNKYFDLTKDILVCAGGNILRVHPPQFMHGVHPLGGLIVYMPGGYDMLNLKVTNGQLKVSAIIKNFQDKVVAKIVDNELFSKGINKYAGSDYFEVFDDQNIPVLQIYLVPKENKIVLNGAFNYGEGFVVLTDRFMRPNGFLKNKLLMSPHERDSLEYIFKSAASAIKPIHE